MLFFTPTIYIEEAPAMPSFVSASLALGIAVGGVVDAAPHAAADELVRRSTVLRGRHDHQEGDADQQQHRAVALHHFCDEKSLLSNENNTDVSVKRRRLQLYSMLSLTIFIVKETAYSLVTGMRVTNKLTTARDFVHAN